MEYNMKISEIRRMVRTELKSSGRPKKPSLREMIRGEVRNQFNSLSNPKKKIRKRAYK